MTSGIVAAMRWVLAATLAVVPVSRAAAQGPTLTLAAATEQAVRAQAETMQPTGTTPVRVGEVVAEIRRAFTELSVARAGLALYDAQAPILLDMGDSGSGPDPDAEMNRHDPSRAAAMARVATMRVTWRERTQLAEIRLNAALGRPLDTVIQPLAPRTFSDVPADVERTALGRSAILAEAEEQVRQTHEDAARRDAALARRDGLAAGIRRQVREAVVRVNAARERSLVSSKTLVPQMQHAYEAARLAYASARLTLMDVFDSYRLLLEARLQDVDAAGAYDRARVDLEIAIGDAPERLSSMLPPAEEP